MSCPATPCWWWSPRPTAAPAPQAATDGGGGSPTWARPEVAGGRPPGSRPPPVGSPTGNAGPPPHDRPARTRPLRPPPVRPRRGLMTARDTPAGAHPAGQQTDDRAVVRAQRADGLGADLAPHLTTARPQGVAREGVRQLAERECPGVARAGMTGMSPHLGDEAPLLAIVDGLASDVEAAARAYLDGVWA